MTSREEWIARFQSLRVYKKHGQRAPHKPLLALLALGDLQAGKERLQGFTSFDGRMKDLLLRFGRPTGPNTRPAPEYPFVRLAHDQVWEVPGVDRYRTRTGHSDARRSDLISHDAPGGFPTELHTALKDDPTLIEDVASVLLDDHFPDTWHEDLRADVGLHSPTKFVTAKKRSRDPTFRPRVLTAYEELCAICRLDVRMSGVPFLLDAAHIHWHNQGGSDEVNNGLSLCALHHRAFDRGAIALDDSLRVIVSRHMLGQNLRVELFQEYAGNEIHMPRDHSEAPDPEHLAWHRKEVYRP